MISLIEPKHLLGHFVYFFVLLYVDLTTLAFKQIWLGRDQAVAVLTVGVKITVWLILHCGLFSWSLTHWSYVQVHPVAMDGQMRADTGICNKSEWGGRGVISFLICDANITKSRGGLTRICRFQFSGDLWSHENCKLNFPLWTIFHYSSHTTAK